MPTRENTVPSLFPDGTYLRIPLHSGDACPHERFFPDLRPSSKRQVDGNDIHDPISLPTIRLIRSTIGVRTPKDDVYKFRVLVPEKHNKYFGVFTETGVEFLSFDFDKASERVLSSIRSFRPPNGTARRENFRMAIALAASQAEFEMRVLGSHVRCYPNDRVLVGFVTCPAYDDAPVV